METANIPVLPMDHFDVYRQQSHPLSDEVAIGATVGFRRPRGDMYDDISRWIVEETDPGIAATFLEGSQLEPQQGSLQRPLRQLIRSADAPPAHPGRIVEASLEPAFFHSQPGYIWHSIERARRQLQYPTHNDRFEFFVNSSLSMTFPLFKAITEALDRRSLEATGRILDREPRFDFSRYRRTAPRIATFGMWFSVPEQAAPPLHDVLQAVVAKRNQAFAGRDHVRLTAPIADGVSMGERTQFLTDYIDQRALLIARTANRVRRAFGVGRTEAAQMLNGRQRQEIPAVFKEIWSVVAAKHVTLDNISWRSRGS